MQLGRCACLPLCRNSLHLGHDVQQPSVACRLPCSTAGSKAVPWFGAILCYAYAMHVRVVCAHPLVLRLCLTAVLLACTHEPLRCAICHHFLGAGLVALGAMCSIIACFEQGR
jgi:hypothetical protein